MMWSEPNRVVQWISDPSRTAGGGWVIDSHGQKWAIVDAFPPRGTADTQAIIGQDGIIRR